MRDRFNAAEVWLRAGLPVAEIQEHAFNSDVAKVFRARLFTRIVPILRDIGLFGPKMRKTLAEMGVLDYAKVDAQAILANDERVAEDFDRKRFVQQQIAVAE